MESFLKKAKRDKNLRLFGYILALLAASRLLLTIIGVSSRVLFEPIYGNWHEWHFSDNLWLDIWGVWDTGWYLDIAQNGYSEELKSDLPKKVCCGQSNLGFFPMYPILIKGLSYAIKDLFLSGIIVSNISLILSAFVLYKLVEIKEGERVARLSVMYLFLFPTSFILSGVFSESLFLLFLLLTFYFAQKSRFLISGLAGFFMTATRFTGVFVIVPILFKYLEVKKFRFKDYRSNAFSFLLIILPAVIYGFYTFLKFGDIFAYYKAKGFTWGLGNTNPLTALLGFLTSQDPSLVIVAIFCILEVILIFNFRKKIGTSYTLLSLIFIGIPAVSDYDSFFSLPRYSITVFPLFIILALLSKSKMKQWFLTITLAVIQGFFMACWVNAALIK